MDGSGELQRSSASPCRGIHGAEWPASAATSSSSMLVVWMCLIFVVLSDVVLIVTATETVQPAHRRVPGMSLRPVHSFPYSKTQLFGLCLTGQYFADLLQV